MPMSEVEEQGDGIWLYTSVLQALLRAVQHTMGQNFPNWLEKLGLELEIA